MVHRGLNRLAVVRGQIEQTYLQHALHVKSILLDLRLVNLHHALAVADLKDTVRVIHV